MNSSNSRKHSLSAMDELFREMLEESVVAVGERSVRLEVRNGPEDGRDFRITTGTVRIGRQLAEPDRSQTQETVSNLVIRSDKAVSREHCELTALDGNSFILK